MEPLQRFPGHLEKMHCFFVEASKQKRMSTFLALIALRKIGIGIYKEQNCIALKSRSFWEFFYFFHLEFLNHVTLKYRLKLKLFIHINKLEKHHPVAGGGAVLAKQVIPKILLLYILFEKRIMTSHVVYIELFAVVAKSFQFHNILIKHNDTCYYLPME